MQNNEVISKQECNFLVADVEQAEEDMNTKLEVALREETILWPDHISVRMRYEME